MLNCLSDPDVPWYVRALLVLSLAYIISPIDLIPDFIPIVGLLDEAILLPVIIFVVWRLLPVQMRDKYENQQQVEWPRKLVALGAVIVVCIWLIVLLSTIYIFYFMSRS